MVILILSLSYNHNDTLKPSFSHRYWIYGLVTVMVVTYTPGVYLKYKVLREQDKFDEGNQTEAVTIEDAVTEDVTNP